MKFFTDHAVDCPGDDVERTLELAMKHINDCTCGNERLHKSPHDCLFHEVNESNNNSKYERT